MGSLVTNERDGAEIVYGAEDCHRHSMELLDELGFPRSVMPLKNLIECGRVKSTGFVWMKQSAPSEHYFKGTATKVSYAAEVTAHIENGKMKKMTGVKSKQFMLWVPITEMSLVDNGAKIYFKTSIGVGRAFPTSAFEEEEKI